MLSRARATFIILAASAGLGGCVGMNPYGMSVGYGNGGYYDPYGGYGGGYGGYGGYGAYGSSYGSGYGYGSPYYGWYDDYYYPGTGYYVYNSTGNRYRWSDAQRRYWESRRGDRRGRDNWSGYRNRDSSTSPWRRPDGQSWMGRDDRRSDGAASTQQRRGISRTRPSSDASSTETGRRGWGSAIARQSVRSERSEARQERRTTRSESRQSRSDARQARRESRRTDTDD